MVLILGTTMLWGLPDNIIFVEVEVAPVLR
jgi:hypothetical protein